MAVLDGLQFGFFSASRFERAQILRGLRRIHPHISCRALDSSEGLQPTALILTYGSTNTSGCDDVKAFKDLAEEMGTKGIFDREHPQHGL